MLKMHSSHTTAEGFLEGLHRRQFTERYSHLQPYWQEGAEGINPQPSSNLLLVFPIAKSNQKWESRGVCWCRPVSQGPEHNGKCWSVDQRRLMQNRLHCVHCERLYLYFSWLYSHAKIFRQQYRVSLEGGNPGSGHISYIAILFYLFILHSYFNKPGKK